MKTLAAAVATLAIALAATTARAETPPDATPKKNETVVVTKSKLSRAGDADPYIKVQKPKANSLNAPEPGKEK